MSLPSSYKHQDPEQLKMTDRLDITYYIRTYLLEVAEHDGQKIKINSDYEAMRITALLNETCNTQFKSIMGLNGVPYWHEQKVAHVPSNLGRNKGVLFYFICNWCDKRVKYLYQYDLLRSPICRTCCRIKCKRRKPEERFPAGFFNSREEYMRSRYPSNQYADNSEYELN